MSGEVKAVREAAEALLKRMTTGGGAMFSDASRTFALEIDALRRALDRPATPLVEALEAKAAELDDAAQRARDTKLGVMLAATMRAAQDAYLEAARLAREAEGAAAAAARPPVPASSRPSLVIEGPHEPSAECWCDLCMGPSPAVAEEDAPSGAVRHAARESAAAVQAERARILDIVGELRRPDGRGLLRAFGDMPEDHRRAVAGVLGYIANKIVETEP